MYFLEARLTGDRRRRVFVQRAEMAREVELLVDVEGLVTEDYGTISTSTGKQTNNDTNSQATPLSATSSAL